MRMIGLNCIMAKKPKEKRLDVNENAFRIMEESSREKPRSKDSIARPSTKAPKKKRLDVNENAFRIMEESRREKPRSEDPIARPSTKAPKKKRPTKRG